MGIPAIALALMTSTAVLAQDDKNVTVTLEGTVGIEATVTGPADKVSVDFKNQAPTKFDLAVISNKGAKLSIVSGHDEDYTKTDNSNEMVSVESVSWGASGSESKTINPKTKDESHQLAIAAGEQSVNVSVAHKKDSAMVAAPGTYQLKLVFQVAAS